MVHLHAYVHDDLAAKLRASAAANDRSLAGELRRALRLYVEVIDRRSIDGAQPRADHAYGGGANSTKSPAPLPPP